MKSKGYNFKKLRGYPLNLKSQTSNLKSIL